MYVLVGPQAVDAIARAVVDLLRASDAPRLLSIPEAAKVLGISPRKVQMEIQAGRLLVNRGPNGRSKARIDREELNKWIQRGNGQG